MWPRGSWRVFFSLSLIGRRLCGDLQIGIAKQYRKAVQPRFSLHRFSRPFLARFESEMGQGSGYG